MKKHLPIIVLLGCAVVLALGLLQLFTLRFARGDVYPAYSSLRADPLGAMALYDSLGRIPGLAVSRDFTDSDRLPEEPGTVYLQFAGRPDDWQWLSPEAFREVQGFLTRGNRLVVAFFPETSTYDYLDRTDVETNSADSSPSRARHPRMAPGQRLHKHLPAANDDSDVDLGNQWGFGLAFKKLAAKDGAYEPAPVFRQADLPLPESLDWHSALVFTNLNRNWRVVYSRGPDAVVIERAFGRGSVVFATDSYFVSNEAMARDRHADLLAWLIGPDRQLVFDESHFGIVNTTGITALMRQYRLHGVALGLLLLAGLYIWKNYVSLVPPVPDPAGPVFVTGKDSASGFVNLLRRNIAPRDLLAACFSEWKKSHGPAEKNPPPRWQQAEAIFASENPPATPARDPVAVYRKMSAILGQTSPKL